MADSNSVPKQSSSSASSDSVSDDSPTEAQSTPQSQSLAQDAPDVALATIYQNLAHSSILAMQNAVQQQQNTWTVQMAVTAKLVNQILSDAPSPMPGDPLYDLFDDLDNFEDFDDEDGEF